LPSTLPGLLGLASKQVGARPAAGDGAAQDFDANDRNHDGSTLRSEKQAAWGEAAARADATRTFAVPGRGARTTSWARGLALSETARLPVRRQAPAPGDSRDRTAAEDLYGRLTGSELRPPKPVCNDPSACKVCPVSVRKLPEGHSICAGAVIFNGTVFDLAECSSKCTLESDCMYYSYWSHNKMNYCSVTESCAKRAPSPHKTTVYQRIVPRTAKQIGFQFLGMFDSGTNLLERLVFLNFPTCCRPLARLDLAVLQVPASDWCIRFGTAYKHSNPAGFLAAALGKRSVCYNPGRVEYTQKADIVIATLVRDPLSHLASWRKAPYSLQQCTLRRSCSPKRIGGNCMPSAAWLTNPCNVIASPKNIRDAGGCADGSFSSLPQLWNHWSGGMLKIRDEAHYRSLMLVRFEDLVRDEEGFLRALARRLGVELPARPTLAIAPAKAHGQSRGRKAELAYLEQRMFVRTFSAPELQAVCVRLNKTLARELGYATPECHWSP